ncbi:MAG: hypothetical protein FWD60_00960 [Candidatus Azobacteroides sp.]|nr:hypothetical protein [Candidatus Azobacteroides sp.]
MSTATIINNIQKLPIAERQFVVEQILQSIYNVERKQTEFTERNAVEQGYADYLNGNTKSHLTVKKRYERYL